MRFDREWWWDELLHSLASYSLLSLHAYKIEDCRTLSPSCLVSQLTRTRCCLQDLDLFSFFFNFWKIILQMNIQAANYVEWSEIITSVSFRIPFRFSFLVWLEEERRKSYYAIKVTETRKKNLKVFYLAHYDLPTVEAPRKKYFCFCSFLRSFNFLIEMHHYQDCKNLTFSNRTLVFDSSWRCFTTKTYCWQAGLASFCCCHRGLPWWGSE